MLTSQEVAWVVYSVLRGIQNGETQLARPPLPCQVWKPPDYDQLKINVDGAFRKEDSAGACGFIIRNHNGVPMLAGAVNISPALDGLAMEMAACLFALESAERFGISRVELETDSSQLREAITSYSRELSAGGVLFRSVREFLTDQFICTKILIVPQSCNSSTHEIARIAMSWDPGQSSVWSDPLPEFVDSVVDW